MSIATLLTVIRPDQDDTVLKQSLDIAAGRHLIVMVVAEAPPVPASAYDMLNGEHWTLEVERARVWAKERAAEVEKLLASSETSGEVIAHVAGPAGVSDLVAAACRYADLVLVDPAGGQDKGLTRSIVTGALFESGTPVLLGASGNIASGRIGTAIISWNATPEASRAVKAALPLLQTAAKVKVVLVDPVPSPLGHGEEPGMNIGRFLARHGIDAEVMPLPSEGRSPDEVLTAQVKASGADLLVMGGYGHSRLRERIFGGTTEAILSDPPCPVLMAH